MRNPDWLQSALDSFETKTQPFMEISVSGAITSARAQQGDLDNNSWTAFLAECSAFTFSEKPDRNSIWNTYFAPLMEMEASDGTKRVDPDIAQLSEQTVQHWEERVSSTVNYIMKARYADCIWDLEGAITGGKRQPRFALIAAQAYIDTAKHNGFAGGLAEAVSRDQALSIVGVRMLARAIQLARSTKSRELAADAAEELIRFCGHHGSPAYAGIWLAPCRILYGQKDLLTLAQKKKIIADLEEMLSRTSNVENGSDFNPFAAKDAADLLSKHYKDVEQTKRLTKIYGTAVERMAQEASPMLALAWMEPVIERYQQVGLKSDSERLAMAAAEKGKRIGEDLKSYTVKVPIERDVVEERTNALLSGAELDHKLFRIALAFTPTVAEAEQTLDIIRESAPLLSLIGRDIISSEGHTVARIGSLDVDREGRMQYQIAEHIGQLQPFLSYALDELKRRDGPTASQVANILFECPLFTQRRRELIIRGIAAYLAEDWVTMIHVLVPQMEEVLRNLLTEMRIPSTKPTTSKRSDKRWSVTDFKNMAESLSDQRVKEVLGEDRWRYLSVLYIDRSGLNLRNDLAHGLLSMEAFNPSMADLVFHSFLCMCTLRKAPQSE